MTKGLRTKDREQDAVITAPTNERQIVESPPGCGKTDVACARAVYLTASGVNGPQILFLSFTRTAVREIRARMKSIAKDNDNVRGVDVRTLDSWAWWFVHNCADGISAATSFDESIKKASALLKAPTQKASGYLSLLQHVQIDEAQDLVGPRAEMVRHLLEKLRCGWTVYLDRAQAIYEWSEDGHGGTGDTFLRQLPTLASGKGVVQKELSTDHRASSPEQKALLKESREIVLGGNKDPATRLRKRLLAGSRLLTQSEFVKKLKGASDSTLVLFRTRAECLEASNWLSEAGVSHRLRMGGLPRTIEPWIALVVNQIARAEFSEKDLTAAIEKVRVLPQVSGEIEKLEAWPLLRRIARGSPPKLISVPKLADGLSKGTDVDDVLRKDLGPSGPILGTIHGSKGREADVVYAFLQREGREDESEEEEARVMYVALSRARSQSIAHDNIALPSKYTDAGRVWRYLQGHRRPRIRIEIGREGDVDVIGAIAASEQPALQQSLLMNWDNCFWPLQTHRENEPGLEGRRYRHLLYRVDSKGALSGSALGSLSGSWGDEIYKQVVLPSKWASTPGWIYDIRLIGTGTVAAPSTHPIIPQLPEPYRTTRIWLAPVIVSWAWTQAPGKKKRTR